MQRDLNKSRFTGLLRALSLRCAYCGNTPFICPADRKPKTILPRYFLLNEGCAQCDYPFEREDGYYTGASWMFSYALGSLVGFATAGLLLWRDLNSNLAFVISCAALAGAGVALITIPIARSLWLFIDHCFHPLEDFETLARRRKHAP